MDDSQGVFGWATLALRGASRIAALACARLIRTPAATPTTRMTARPPANPAASGRVERINRRTFELGTTSTGAAKRFILMRNQSVATLGSYDGPGTGSADAAAPRDGDRRPSSTTVGAKMVAPAPPVH